MANDQQPDLILPFYMTGGDPSPGDGFLTAVRDAKFQVVWDWEFRNTGADFLLSTPIGLKRLYIRANTKGAKLWLDLNSHLWVGNLTEA